MRAYTPEEYRLLTARNVTVGFGAELLDENDQVLEDLSADLAGGEVERSNYSTVHGTCTLELLRALDWTTARVRPWQTLRDAAGSARFNLGVYLLTTPEQPLGEDTTTYTVQGYDKLHLLQHIVGDTYVVAAGTGYLDAVRQAITDAGVTGLPPLFDGTAQDKTLPEPMVWVLDPSDLTTWIGVVNDLLSAIGYRGLWVDHDGRFRSEPYQSPAIRPPEWVYDLADPRTNIVGPERTLTVDEFEQLNWWRFIRDGLDTRPLEGTGQYTVDRRDGAPKRGKIERLTAADQESLVAQGDQIVDTDTRVTRKLEISTGPLPILGHFDVATFLDPELGALKVLSHSHTIPLDGGDDVSINLEIL